MSQKIQDFAELISGHIGPIQTMTALEEAMILPDLHAGWKLIFDQFHIHIDTVCMKNDTLLLPFDVVREAQVCVAQNSTGTYRTRVIEILQRLLQLADKIVPDRLKDEPAQTTNMLECWVGYDVMRSRYEQFDAFFEDGAYTTGAPSIIYHEWIEDIHMTQGRWKLILERLLSCVERGEFFLDVLGLPDEPPLTKRTRKKELKRALGVHGLRMRKDSRMCLRYIRHGGDVNHVAETMREMDFLFTLTDYRTRMCDLYERESVTEQKKEDCKLCSTRDYIRDHPTELDRVPGSLYIRLCKKQYI